MCRILVHCEAHRLLRKSEELGHDNRYLLFSLLADIVGACGFDQPVESSH